MARVLCKACSISSAWSYSVSPAGVRRVGYELRSTRSVPAQASSDWMRRENAGCVTWRSCAERLKLRVSANEMKSSNHLVSMTLLRALLQRPHGGVAAFGRQQFGMGAALNDAAGVHHQDLMGIHHG